MTWRMTMRRQRPASRYALRAGGVFAAVVTAAGLAATTPAQAATSYHLRVSVSSDRTGAHALASSRLRGAVYVFVTPPTDVKSVAFYVDDPKRLHKPSQVDTTQPYDLRGGTAAAATPWNTANLRDGKHTVTAVVTTATGHHSVVTSAFTATNPTPRPVAIAAKAGNARVTLTWASGGGRTGAFQIYRSTTKHVSFKKPINAKPLAKTASSYIDKKVKNGTRYYYVIRAISSRHASSSGARVSARPLVPPSRPTGVKATSGDSQVAVKWSSGGGTVKGWRIYRSGTPNVPLTTPFLTLPAATRSFVDKPRINGNTYYYRVQAYADSFRATSAAVNGTPIPAPDTIAATPDDGSATVTWHVGAGATAITGFRVYVGTSPSVSTSGTPAASTSHADARSLVVVKDGHGDPLVNGTRYYFRVVSVSANGRAASASAAGATPVAPPAAPTSLTATASSGQILLEWVSTGAHTTGYNIFRANGNNVAVPTTGTPINPSLIDPSVDNYTDLSVAANTSYTYVVVAVGPSRDAVSPKATAKTPAINNGPTASGWGGSLAPTNLDWPAGPIKTALGSQLTDFRYVFNRIGTTNVDKTDTLHVKPWSDLTIKNNGGSAVTISSLSLTGAYSIAFARQGVGTTGADVTFPYTLAPGAAIHVEIQFDYCRTCSASNLPVKGVQYGVLTVHSNDPGHPAATLPLAGAWQATAGGADELPLSTFINQVLGIPTRLTGGYDSEGVYKGINYGNGLVAAVGEEVLSPYWQSTGGSVAVRQIVATHSAGGHEPLQWFAQGDSGTTHSFLQQAGTDYQTLLPGGSNGPRAESSFDPGGQTFGFRVNSGSTADWSDDTLNQGPTLANDIRHGCEGPCGHHVRFYPLKNASGGLVPNTYLMCVDSQGINLDFNDVDYIVTGIRPA